MGQIPVSRAWFCWSRVSSISWRLMTSWRVAGVELTVWHHSWPSSWRFVWKLLKNCYFHSDTETEREWARASDWWNFNINFTVFLLISPSQTLGGRMELRISSVSLRVSPMLGMSFKVNAKVRESKLIKTRVRYDERNSNVHCLLPPFRLFCHRASQPVSDYYISRACSESPNSFPPWWLHEQVTEYEINERNSRENCDI